MRLGIVYGVPDDGMVGTRLNAAQDAAVVEWPGRTSLQPHLARLGFDFEELWLGPAPGGRTRVRLAEGRPLFNDLADADLYAFALAQLEVLAAKAGLPVFNPPDGVLNSRRDRAAALLADVEGLVAPPVARFAPRSRAEVAAALAEAGLSGPVIVRVAGGHGGKDSVRLEAPDDLDALDRIPWGGRTLYAIAFRDFRDPDGRYRKHRLVWVGGALHLRHVVVGDDWFLHAHSRSDRPEDVAEEEARLASFETDLAPKVAPTMAAIADRLGLDYFGVDCHVAADGRMTLFEANASMNVCLNVAPSPNMWDKPIRRVLRDLAGLLRRPDRWRRGRARVQGIGE